MKETNKLVGGVQFVKSLIGRFIQAQKPKISDAELERNSEAKSELRRLQKIIRSAEGNLPKGELDSYSETDGVNACQELLEILKQVKPELLEILNSKISDEPIHIQKVINLIMEMTFEKASNSPARFHAIVRHIYPCIDYLQYQKTFLKEK